MRSKKACGEIAWMPDQRLPELTRSVSGGVALEDPVRPSTDATWDDDSLLVRKRIDELCGIVIQRLAIPFSIPTFDLKLRGLAAGRAHLRHAHLSFNPVFLRENRSHFLLHTVAHEVAHLVAYAVWGRASNRTDANGSWLCRYLA